MNCFYPEIGQLQGHLYESVRRELPLFDMPFPEFRPYEQAHLYVIYQLVRDVQRRLDALLKKPL